MCIIIGMYISGGTNKFKWYHLYDISLYWFSYTRIICIATSHTHIASIFVFNLSKTYGTADKSSITIFILFWQKLGQYFLRCENVSLYWMTLLLTNISCWQNIIYVSKVSSMKNRMCIKVAVQIFLYLHAIAAHSKNYAQLICCCILLWFSTGQFSPYFSGSLHWYWGMWSLQC